MYRLRESGSLLLTRLRPPREPGPAIDPEAQAPPPTPIYITPRTRLVLLLLVGLALYLVATRASSVVSLLLIGSTVALLLSFPVRFLTRFLPRKLAIAIVALGTGLLAIIFLALLIPFAVTEISQFAESLPGTVDDLQEMTRAMLTSLHDRGWIEQEPDAMLADIEAAFFDAGQRIVTDLLTNTVGWLTRSVSLLITTFGVIFVSIYLLADIPRFKDSFVRMWAPAYRSDAVVLWDTLGRSLSRYLGGLLFSIFIQGVMAFVALSLMGVPYALILGLWMSVTAILPYIGAFLGGIPAVLVALTISWQMALATALVYVAINQLEGNFITPRIQGSAVRVHPLMIFFSVIAGSSMFGPIGAILAVPVLAVLRVLIEFFWVRLRVHEDQPTLLSAMRADLAGERMGPPIPTAGVVEDELEYRREQVIEEPPGMTGADAYTATTNPSEPSSG